MATKKMLEMVKEFHCSGCEYGIDPDTCASYKEVGWGCDIHEPATFIFPYVGRVALGLPKGFCRVGETRQTNLVRLWESGDHPTWDHLNIPVWAMELNGYLFVRTIGPRIAAHWIDVIESGTIKELCPQAINVADFYDEID